MSDNLKLYNYYRSSASYRIRLVLAYKEMDYQYIPVHLLNQGGEQHLADYQAKNPMRQVPTLHDGNFCLSQSMAILEYLEEAYPDKPQLLPKDLKERALVREFCEIINSGMQPLQNLSTLQALEEFFSPLAEVKQRWIHHWLAKGYVALEEKVKKYGKMYCLGNQISAADLFLMAQVFSSQRFQYDLAQHPHLQRIHNFVCSLEVLQKAHPDLQPQ